MNTLAERLRYARNLRNLTQKELAIRANVSQGAISNYENQFRYHPRNILRLATALNVMGWDAAKKLAEQENLAVLLIRHHNDEFEEYISTAFDETVEIKN